MKKIWTIFLTASMLFSSADAFAGVAYSEVSMTDTYQYVNVATKAAIKCDTGYDFQINDAKYIIDISKTSYAVVPSGSGLVFDLGKEYNVTKINVTNEYRDDTYILQGSKDGNSYVQLTTFSKNEATHTAYEYYNTEKTFSNADSYRYYRIITAETASSHHMCFTDVQLLINYNIQPANWEIKRVISSLEPTTAVTSDGSLKSASLIADNITTGDYCQADAGAEYIKYDLGQTYSITELSCIYRGENKDFGIYASKDDTNYDMIYFAKNSGGGYDNPSNTGTIYLDAPEYRYIKFIRPDKNALIGIRELYLYTTTPTEEYWSQIGNNEYWFDASVGAAVDNDTNTWTQTGSRSTDRDTTTAAIATAKYITYDLEKSYKLGGFKIDYEYRADTTSLALYGSTDNKEWTKLYDIPKGTDRNRETKTGNFPHGEYRYIKLQADDDGGVFYIYELIMNGIGQKNNTENAALGKELNENKIGITDGTTEHNSAIAGGQDYTLDMGEIKYVKSVRVVYSDRNGHYTVYGSQNGTDYTALMTYDGTASDAASAVSKDTGVVNVKPGSYRYIKIHSSTNVVNLYELEVYAEDIQTEYNTTPGINEYEILDNSAVLGSNTFTDEFFLPFDAKDVKLKYSAEQDINIELIINDKEYYAHLADDETEYTLNFPEVLRHGDINIEVTADAEVTILQITFDKANVSWKAPFMRELPDLTQFEQDISTAVIFDMNSPLIIVNGSKRYIDYDNIALCPKSIRGNIYLPVKTLARAIGMYYEDYPELTYVFMRNNDYELKADGKICTVTKGGVYGEIKQIENPFVYVNGEAYAPVRKICECINKTMLYNDGMIIVEDSSVRAHAIAENAEYMDKLTSIFASYAYKLQGNTYYVAQSSGASDDNPGTEQFPFKTLKKACEIAEAGDTVIIRNGIYREVLAPKNNGTAGAPITFKAMEGEDVTISAFDVLKGFEEVSEGDVNYNKNIPLYKAATDIDLGYTRNFILYKGNEIIQGRYPNSKTNLIANSWPDGVTGSLWPTKGNIKVKSKYCNTPSHRDFRVYVSDTDLNQPDDYWKGATFIGEIERGWALTSGKIEYSTEGKIKIDNSTISFCWNQFGKNYGAFASDYGYITDSIKTVDIPGEWQIENGYLYVCPPENETADSLELEIKARQNVINLDKSSFINIEDVNTTGGGVCMDNSVMCVINGGTHKYLSHFIANNDTQQCFLDGVRTDWITKSDNYLTRGELGICIGGEDCAVLNTQIDYSAAAGILLYGKYAYIENNIIRNTGYGGAYYSGIFCTSEGYEPKTEPRGGYYVYNNSIENTGRASFCMTTVNYRTKTDEEYKIGSAESDRGQFMPCEIAYNYFYNSNLIARDTGAYYIHGNNSGNDIAFTKLHNNVICNVQGNDNFEDAFQPFACESYFYDDAWVAGINEYDNIGFATNAKQAFTSNEPVTGGSEWSQMASNSNNTDAGIIPGGIDDITAEQYPSGKPFFAGAMQNAEKFLLNYNNSERKIYNLAAKDAVSSPGTIMKDGRLELADGEYVLFEDVDINNIKNRLIIHYTGDRYNSPEFTVMIGNSQYSVRPECRGYDVNYECTYYLDIAETGMQDIKIIKTGGGRFSLCGIDIIEDAIVRNQKNKNYIIGGAFDDYNTVSAVQKPKSMIRRNKNLLSSGNYNYAYGLFANPTLIYNDIETDEFDSVEISLQLDEMYDGTGIQLYMDTPNGIPILETEFSGTTWDDFQNYQIKLNNTYSAGTHNYYVKITGASNATMNLYYIKFYKEETTTDVYEPNYQEVNFAVGTKEIITDGTVSNGNLINLIDNSDTTYAACSSAKYIQLDMGRQHCLKRFGIIQDFRINSYVLQASNDGENFVDLADINKTDAIASGDDAGNSQAYAYFGSCEENEQSYRYYRITGSSEAVMKVYDIKLHSAINESKEGYKEVNIPARMTPSYTVSPNASVVSQVERLFDEDLSTYTIISNTEFVEFDLGELYDLTALKFVYQGRNSLGYRISASADGINYDTIYFAPRIPAGITQYSNKVYCDRQKYRYIKVENVNLYGETMNNIFYGLELSVYGLVPNTSL